MKKTDFKIHILYKFVEGPWGGGNQFLKSLRGYLTAQDACANSPGEAAAVMFNSHQDLEDVLAVKRKYPRMPLVHRVDGPIYGIRGRDRDIDMTIYRFNQALADGTVFQSAWSRDKNRELGMGKAPYETVIINAPDPSVFHPGERRERGDRTRLVATSWSDNMRRGFSTYQYLDGHLDFSRYDMTFIGNSPVEFKNIRHIPAVPSRELAPILREHDIFITASFNDPCSNSLIEALHCGLPAVARNDGGHPEIVGSGGVLFHDESDLLAAIDRVSADYDFYRGQISLPGIEEVGRKYLEFARSIYLDALAGKYRPRRINSLNAARLNVRLRQRRFIGRLRGVLSVLSKRNKK